MRAVRWFAQRPWLAALIVALGLAAADAGSRIRHVEFVSGLAGETVEPPAVDPASPTGYALGCRTLILPAVGADGYQWIMQTQAMLAGGGWRLHHVDYDNAPTGREAHWASLFRWWIALLAWGRHVVSGQPLGAAVEWAALRANPLLLGLLVAGLVPLVARRFGSAAASVLALGLVAAFPFNLYFAADYPDHHGILEACGMLTVLFLVAGGGGLVRVPGPPAPGLAAGAGAAAWLPTEGVARRWFAASAVAGGVGLWVSTASEVPVLVGVGLGVVWSGWLGRGAAPGAPWRCEPTLWRLWGNVGGAVSLAAYLLEYFPSHLGFRLEVNHPLYALAWVGGGELLCRLWRLGGPRGLRWSRRDAGAALVAAAAVAVLPVVILLTKDRTFLVANRFVWLLGTQYVSEGQSLARFIAHHPSGLLVWGGGVALLLVLPVWLVLRRGAGPVWRAQAALALAPVLLFLLLTLREIRWWGLELGLLFAALAPVFAALRAGEGARRRQGWVAAGCGLLLLPGAVGVVRSALQPPDPGPGDIFRLEERDVAQWLRQRMGRDRMVVASTPVTTNHLIYFGGCQGLGTLYWENTEGFKHAAAIFAAAAPGEAHDLVRRYGVTHVVLLSWDDFAADFVRFYRELPASAPVPADAFILRLQRGAVPPWLRPIPYALPASEVLKGQRVLIFEVTPDQSPAEAAAREADYLLEMGQNDSAAAVARQLEEYPDDLQAQVMLALVQGRTGALATYAATLGRVRGELAQAPSLEAGDRIRLALVLAAGGDMEPARGQLREVMARLDERTLRRLTTGELRDLLKLTDVLGVELPGPGLRRLAVSLYPPMLRRSS
ncbi:MAG TPA: hypothetical protein VMD31_05470 [Opitutaceae bacterium]|nr:hypothetical protein [Opitutaceae bacterium]